MIKSHILLVTVFLTISLVLAIPNGNGTYIPFEFPVSGYICTEEIGRDYLKWLEYIFSEKCNQRVNADWNYSTNLTDENEAIAAQADQDFLDFEAKIQEEILLKCPHWHDFKDHGTQKQFKYLLLNAPGTCDYTEMKNILNQMQSSYSTATVCDMNNNTKCDIGFGEILANVANLSDPDSAKYYWTAWHDEMSKQVPPLLYATFIMYQNQLAIEKGFKHDMSQWWIKNYEDGTHCFSTEKFKSIIFTLWNKLSPMYKTLHAYVRMKLREKSEYAKLIDKCGYLPAYITGNMWAQDWSALYNMTKPYPNASSFDVTQSMIDQGYTPLKMVQTAEKFFTGLGLPKMTNTFWEKSIFEYPLVGDMDCGYAWDMCKGKGSKDFRIEECLTITMADFINVHWDMSLIEYYMAYTNLSAMFRDEAMPGFLNAVGDCVTLSVGTRGYLCKLNLSAESDCNPGNYSGGSISDTDMNSLFLNALQNLAFMPWALSMDTWRWAVFEGKVEPDEYNTLWWKIRMENQGIKPPTDRNKPYLFDPAAKFHIVANEEYLNFFVENVLEFQFYEALCIAAGEFDPKNPNSKPLCLCDFSGSKAAGKLLRDMMELGYSRGWPDALEAITGNRTLSVEPMETYFEPLIDYMEKELKVKGEIPGFGENCDDVNKKYYHYHHKP